MYPANQPLQICSLTVLLGNSLGAFVRAYLCYACHGRVVTHSCDPGVRRRRVFCRLSTLMEREFLQWKFVQWKVVCICWRHDCFRTFRRFLKLQLYQLQRYITHQPRYVRRVLSAICARALELQHCDGISNARSQLAAAFVWPHRALM